MCKIALLAYWQSVMMKSATDKTCRRINKFYNLSSHSAALYSLAFKKIVLSGRSVRTTKKAVLWMQFSLKRKEIFFIVKWSFHFP